MPCSVGGDRAHRRIPARRARRGGSTDHSGEALRTGTRDRYSAGSFDRVVTHGRSELVLVTGSSGIGKSSVVNELHKAIVLPRGIFISGKFDLRLKGIPYSTLAQAFQGLVRQFLRGGEEDIDHWRDAIREAVGNHASLLTDLIPELVRLIGPQAPVAALSPAETRLRFQLVFQRFVNVFARPEHPLVIFVDDLQWLDPATSMVQYLITRSDIRHLLLIGAYRDNEVGPDHPLALALDTVRQTDTPISELRLGPLSTEDVNRLLCDTLRLEPADVRPLALLVHRKTGVFRGPISHKPWRGASSHVRSPQASLDVGPRRHRQQGFHRQSFGSHDRQVETTAYRHSGSIEAARLSR
jgi:AAA ATPase domain